VFVLGYVDGHYVVGVIADENFFIMATRRLYSRHSLPSPGIKPLKFCPKMLEVIDLPLWLPYEYALTMLEIRQILRHSREYACDYQSIAESLGILGNSYFLYSRHFFIIFILYSDFESPSLSLFHGSELRSRKKHSKLFLKYILNVK
jgi:hypothetical protein